MGGLSVSCRRGVGGWGRTFVGGLAVRAVFGQVGDEELGGPAFPQQHTKHLDLLATGEEKVHGHAGHAGHFYGGVGGWVRKRKENETAGGMNYSKPPRNTYTQTTHPPTLPTNVVHQHAELLHELPGEQRVLDTVHSEAAAVLVRPVLKVRYDGVVDVFLLLA